MKHDDDDIQEYVRPCQHCDYHKKRAQLWREEAYRQAGYPLPERGWVGLTEAQCGVLWKVDMTPFDYYQAIETKLKEKNT
jgi:hypothetical protein